LSATVHRSTRLSALKRQVGRQVYVTTCPSFDGLLALAARGRQMPLFIARAQHKPEAVIHATGAYSESLGIGPGLVLIILCFPHERECTWFQTNADYSKKSSTSHQLSRRS